MHQVQAVFSSPFETSDDECEGIVPDHEANLDYRLCEINYGKAEGLFLEDLKKMFPDLYESWSRGKDTRFPDGENHGGCNEQTKAFLNSLQDQSGTILVVTHNVVIRCLVGMIWKIPMKRMV